MMTALARGRHQRGPRRGRRQAERRACLAPGLVDELLVYLAPCLLGDGARGMFALPAPLDRLADRTPLRIVGVDPVGSDWRVLARIER